MRLSFSGHRALIVGGTCDLALALARRMIGSGLTPILTARNSEGFQKIRQRLSVPTDRYHILNLNFGDMATLDALFSHIHDDLDYVVDFAQEDLEHLVAMARTEEVFAYFEKNVSFRTELLKRATRVMLKKKKGRLIFISSTAAARPNPGQGFYASAKLACEALYRNIGIEMGGKGITTLSLRAGYIQTGRGEKFLEAGKKKVIDKIPIKRALSVDEVAETILFFLSQSAEGFNAVELCMDGGMTAGK